MKQHPSLDMSNNQKQLSRLWFNSIALAAISGLAFPAIAVAFDVTKATLTPHPENDAPATVIARVPKGDAAEDGTPEMEEKVFLPRNDKLQRFEFQAEGKFTGRDVENRDFATNKMPIDVNFVDVQTDGRSIALTVLFGGPGRIRRAVTMSSFKGEVPFTPETKEGDTWKLSGTLQVGCTTDGRVFGSTGPKINRFSGAIEFPGDNNRTFKVFRIECEPAPAKAPS